MRHFVFSALVVVSLLAAFLSEICSPLTQPLSLDAVYRQQLTGLEPMVESVNATDDAAFYLRNLVYQGDGVEFAGMWDGDARIFPSASGMTTWAESSLLAELLPVMNAIRMDALLNWQRLYLSTGPAWVNCSPIPNEFVVCLAFSERWLAANNIDIPANEYVGFPFTTALVLVSLLAALAVLMVLLLRVRLRWLCERIDEVLHDLRMPLANIGLYLALLRRHSEQVSPHLDVLESEQQRASLMTGSALELSNFRSFGYTVVFGFNKKPHLECSVIQAHLKSKIATWKPALENAGIQVVTDISRMAPCSVCGSVSGLSRVLDNLMDNACRYSPRGRVHIWLVTDANKLELRWMSEAVSNHKSTPMRWQSGIGLRSCLWQMRLNGWRCQQTFDGRFYRLVVAMPMASTKTQRRSVATGGDCHV